MALKNSKHSLLYLCFVTLAVSACGGGSEATNPESAPIAPPVANPPAQPTETVGDVQFTLDNSITESQRIVFDGGEVVLDVPAGAKFTLNIPKGAFLAENTTVAMQSIVDTQGLPPGLTPIAAVSLGPSGADFAVQPTIEIDLRNLPRSVGNVVIFLANDDGTGLTYLLPQGDDPVASVLGNGPYRARVPHFSGVGIAVSDPNGPGVPATDSAETAERKARQELNLRIDVRAREVLMGQRILGEPITEVVSILAEWLSDLRRRVDELNENSTLDDIKKIIKEHQRLEETRQLINGADTTLMLEDTGIGSTVFDKLINQFEFLSNRCIAGNTDAEKRAFARIIFLRQLASADLLSESAVSSLVPVNFCILTEV